MAHCGVGLILSPFLSSRQYYWYISRWVNFLGWWLRVFCGIDYKITGLENIPESPCVVVSNHQSSWDTFFLQRYFFPQSIVLKKELTLIPFFGWALNGLKPISINRGKKQNALKQIICQGKERLNSNMWVLVFPEGTRVPVGETRPHFAGGAMLAIKAGVPILPLAHNAGLYWPPHQLQKTRGTIDVVIGKPIDTTGKSPKQLTLEIQHWIEEMKDQLSQR
jgi:1-acyl-sn-glycerol-3-phosphate acyltransferase